MRRIDRRSAVLAILFVAGACAPAGDAPDSATYDVIVRGGTILDGTGAAGFEGDVAIDGDRIVAVGDLSAATATEVVMAAGLYVTPGFIDAHSHSGSGLDTADRSHAHPLVAQGLTTVVVNPDGGGRSTWRSSGAACSGTDWG